MVWGLDSVVGGAKGLFYGKPISQAPHQHGDEAPSNPQTTTSPTPSPSASFSQPPVSQKTMPQTSTASTTPSSDPSQAATASASDDNYWTNARSRKQFTIFLAGAVFVLGSTRIASRALARKYMQNRPAFYWPSNAPPAMAVNGPIEALEALTVASANVFSSSMMVAGGLLWAFDISSIDDLRRRIRGGLGVDGSGRSEAQVEQDFEEWIAATLDRKRKKEDDARDRAQALGIADLDEVRQQWQNERGKPR